MTILFKYYADMENCESFRGFDFIYILGFFGNFNFKQFRSGFRVGIAKTWTQPEHVLGFILKTQTRPYCLIGRVR